ncbi:hypothetical protein [Mailhella massiliensis]|uniref:Lipoprotein n=1 Tax=Mailhella massiliensis TaxID=1903261 RepID=A0A921AV84_9BACT|nr:hypothetical protein [Mailhella massiliensis]HJD96773.1 hypothetical protein [Mailhella massiliensis]
MKHIPLLCLSLFCLASCATKTTSSVVSYDAAGNPVSTQVHSRSSNDTADTARALGNDVKESVVSGYEWTRDRTLEGYEWVKEKTTGTDNAPAKK